MDKKIEIIVARGLSVEDDFLKFVPETQEQRNLKDGILAVLRTGAAHDFVIHKEVVQSIVKTPKEIQQEVKEKFPRGNVISYRELLLYSAVTIKKLIEEQSYRTEEAWRQVCDYTGVEIEKRLIRNDVTGGYMVAGVSQCTDYAEMHNGVIISKADANSPLLEKVEVWVTVKS